MSAPERIHDVLGVGFGPSNLALAIALDEAARRRGIDCSARFVERQNGFSWHAGMLLPGSSMQISFMKDLVSLRDPTSPLTFVNYLHGRGRLEAFINQRTFFPSRIEFNDYLGWVASHYADRCRYGEEVVAIEPEEDRGPDRGPDGGPDGGTVASLRVTARDRTGATIVRHARNLVIAAGGTPNIPDCFQAMAGNERVFHSSRYLDGIGAVAPEGRPRRRIAVIGGGQSAAEILLDLHARFPRIGIDLIFRGQALKPADDTPFVNEIFNPAFTDFMYGQPRDRRDEIIREFRNTNYAVVDADLIQRIYGILYDQQVERTDRIALHDRSEIDRAESDQEGVRLTVRHKLTGATRSEHYQAVVLATGYERDVRRRLLAGIEPYLEDGELDRAYRLRTVPGFLPQIHLQGYSEISHGLSDTLLSVLAIRSQEIADSLLAAITDHRPDLPVRLAAAPRFRMSAGD